MISANHLQKRVFGSKPRLSGGFACIQVMLRISSFIMSICLYFTPTQKRSRQMTLEEIRQALSDRNLKEVSRLTGIHYTTVYGIATGKHINPTYQTFKTLEAYINGKR